MPALMDGLYSKLIICSGKYNVKKYLFKLLQQIKTIHFWHFNIKKYNVGLKLIDCLYTVFTIVAGSINNNFRAMHFN